MSQTTPNPPTTDSIVQGNERLDLKKLMRQHQSDYTDNTDGIRRLKHSDLILSDIYLMERLKKENTDMREKRPTEFLELCKRKCSFLYNSYTDIFNRLHKDTLDTDIMTEALATLKKIENGEINQHEGSVQMGKLFYNVFASSAVKEREKQEELDSTQPNDENTETNATDESLNKGENISWKDFKVKHLGFHLGAPDEKPRNGPKNGKNAKKSGKSSGKKKK